MRSLRRHEHDVGRLSILLVLRFVLELRLQFIVTCFCAAITNVNIQI